MMSAPLDLNDPALLFHEVIYKKVQDTVEYIEQIINKQALEALDPNCTYFSDIKKLPFTLKKGRIEAVLVDWVQPIYYEGRTSLISGIDYTTGKVVTYVKSKLLELEILKFEKNPTELTPQFRIPIDQKINSLVKILLKHLSLCLKLHINFLDDHLEKFEMNEYTPIPRSFSKLCFPMKVFPGKKCYILTDLLVSKGALKSVFLTLSHPNNCLLVDAKCTLNAANLHFIKEEHANLIRCEDFKYIPKTWVNIVEGKSSLFTHHVIQRFYGLGDLFDLNPYYLTKSPLQIMYDLILGLEEFHNAGFTHQDLKLENILVYEEGNNLRAHITDLFTVSASKEPPKVLRGTTCYMAPEILHTYYFPMGTLYLSKVNKEKKLLLNLSGHTSSIDAKSPRDTLCKGVKEDPEINLGRPYDYIDYVTSPTRDIWALGIVFYYLYFQDLPKWLHELFIVGDNAFALGESKLMSHFMGSHAINFNQRDNFLGDLIHDMLACHPEERPKIYEVKERLKAIAKDLKHALIDD